MRNSFHPSCTFLLLCLLSDAMSSLLRPFPISFSLCILPWSLFSPLFWFLSSLSSHSVSYQSGTFCQQILIEWNFPGLLVKARGSWKLFCVGSSLMEATNILDPWPRMANGWTQFCLCLRKATQLVREPLLFLPCLEVLCIFFPANE